MLCKFAIVGESEKEGKKAAKLEEKNEKKIEKETTFWQNLIRQQNDDEKKRTWRNCGNLNLFVFFCSSCCAIKPRYRSLMKLGLWNRRQRHYFLTACSIVQTGRSIGFPHPSHVPMSHVNLNILSLHRSANEKEMEEIRDDENITHSKKKK